MNILIIGDLTSVHLQRLACMLKGNGHSLIGATLFTPSQSREAQSPFNVIIHRPLIETGNPLIKYSNLLLLSKKLNRMVDDHGIDLINIQVASFYFGFMFFLGRPKVPLVTSFWGTEVWADKNMRIRYLQRKLVKGSAIITVVTERMREKIVDDLGAEKSKVRIIKYLTLGVRSDEMTKVEINSFRKEFRVPKGTTVVTISYASAPRHRQDFILSKLSQMDITFLARENVLFVLPLTYGERGWTERLRAAIESNPLQTFIRIIDRRLTDREVAILRSLTDIFINVPLQDSLSASMLEHFQAGNVVIVGEWLPYDVLFASDLHMIKVSENDLEMLDVLVGKIIEDLEWHKAEVKKRKINTNRIIGDNNWEKVFDEAR